MFYIEALIRKYK